MVLDGGCAGVLGCASMRGEGLGIRGCGAALRGTGGAAGVAGEVCWSNRAPPAEGGCEVQEDGASCGLRRLHAG